MSNFLLSKKIGSWVNPYSLISLFYFTPMLCATMRLSGFQSDSWCQDTITLLSISVLAWGVFPFTILWCIGKQKKDKQLFYRRLKDITPLISQIVIFLSILFIPIYLLDNYLISSYFFPILVHSRLAHDIHTMSTFGLRNFTQAGSSIAILLFAVYAAEKRKMILFLLVIVLFIPLTRGSRFETFIGIVSLVVLNSQLKVFNFFNSKMIFTTVSCVAMLFILFSFVGNVRSSFGGQNQYSFSKSMKMKIKCGYFDCLAYPYVYFSIPFENLDRLIRKNPSQRLGGQFSMMPLVGIFLPTSKIYDDPISLDSIRKYEDPVSPNSVCTSQAYFYMDFGKIGAVLPMFVYMLLWLVLYYNRNRFHIISMLIYSSYCGVFALASFQATMIHPSSFRKMIFMALPFVIGMLLPKRKIKKSPDHGFSI